MLLDLLHDRNHRRRSVFHIGVDANLLPPVVVVDRKDAAAQIQVAQFAERIDAVRRADHHFNQVSHRPAIRIWIANVEPHLVLALLQTLCKRPVECLAHLPHHLLLGESQAVSQRLEPNTDLLAAKLRIVDNIVQRVEFAQTGLKFGTRPFESLHVIAEQTDRDLRSETVSGADGELVGGRDRPQLFRYAGLDLVRSDLRLVETPQEDHHRPGMAACLATRKSGSRAHVDQFDERRLPITLHQHGIDPPNNGFDAFEFSRQLIVIRTRFHRQFDVEAVFVHRRQDRKTDAAAADQSGRQQETGAERRQHDRPVSESPANERQIDPFAQRAHSPVESAADTPVERSGRRRRQDLGRRTVGRKHEHTLQQGKQQADDNDHRHFIHHFEIALDEENRQKRNQRRQHGNQHGGQHLHRSLDGRFLRRQSLLKPRIDIFADDDTVVDEDSHDENHAEHRYEIHGQPHEHRHDEHAEESHRNAPRHPHRQAETQEQRQTQHHQQHTGQTVAVQNIELPTERFEEIVHEFKPIAVIALVELADVIVQIGGDTLQILGSQVVDTEHDVALAVDIARRRNVLEDHPYVGHVSHTDQIAVGIGPHHDPFHVGG